MKTSEDIKKVGDGKQPDKGGGGYRPARKKKK